jgi:glycosyltransferase involved in cell wall biosynthesis
MGKRRHRVLIVVQNLPVPLDRRVWLECLALRSAGIGVSVICPKGPGDPARQEIDGVRIYKYSPPPVARGLAGYALEFCYCWLMTAVLSVRVALRDGFTAIQACNPPDTYWALARMWRIFGKKFVYDQHDLNPEVFLSRFGEPSGRSGRAQLSVLRWLERRTYRAADHVISTNDSYRQIALTRGQCAADRVTTVRSGPDTRAMRPVQPRREPAAGRAYLAVYLGIMGPQDGVDLALRAFAEVVHVHGRTDCHLALHGFGDCLDELKELAGELQLTPYVTFTGRVGLAEIADHLSSADIGICPDPKSPLNDVSTMNKTMEYMAFCLPVLTFDLKETRVSAQEAAVYVESGDIGAFAKAWIGLLDDPDDRVRRGLFARRRVVEALDWSEQARKYLDVWQSVLQSPDLEAPRIAAGAAVNPSPDRRYVPLDDPNALASFIRDRGRGLDSG